MSTDTPERQDDWTGFVCIRNVFPPYVTSESGIHYHPTRRPEHGENGYHKFTLPPGNYRTSDGNDFQIR